MARYHIIVSCVRTLTVSLREGREGAGPGDTCVIFCPTQLSSSWRLAAAPKFLLKGPGARFAAPFTCIHPTCVSTPWKKPKEETYMAFCLIS